MSSSSITVRPIESPTDYEKYFHLANQAFSPNPSPDNARYWHQFNTTAPEFRPEQVRGAFRDGELLGGYIIHERMLRMGVALLSTGCIAAVVTDPAHRHQ